MTPKLKRCSIARRATRTLLWRARAQSRNLTPQVPDKRFLLLRGVGFRARHGGHASSPGGLCWDLDARRSIPVSWVQGGWRARVLLFDAWWGLEAQDVFPCQGVAAAERKVGLE